MKLLLTFPVWIPALEQKLTQIFIFTLLWGTSEGFVEALKAFLKTFEAPQRFIKIKF